MNCFKAYVGRLLMKETPYKRCYFNSNDRNNICNENYDFVWDDGTVLGKSNNIIPVKYEFEDGASADDFKCTILKYKSRLL